MRWGIYFRHTYREIVYKGGRESEKKEGERKKRREKKKRERGARRRDLENAIEKSPPPIYVQGGGDEYFPKEDLQVDSSDDPNLNARVA